MFQYSKDQDFITEIKLKKIKHDSKVFQYSKDQGSSDISSDATVV